MDQHEPEFARATAVEALGDGRWACAIDGGWSAPRGPNGGYVAAIVMRALTAAVDDPERHPRSLTCHYLRPPQPGPAVVHVDAVRTGRNVSALRATLMQDDRECVLALAAFGRTLAEPLRWTLPVPDVPAPEDVEAWPLREDVPPIAQRFEFRSAIGEPPFSSSADAVTGGWLRLREPAPLDGALVACLTDAWLPASYPRLERPHAVPTIDLTIHFRTALPLPDQPVLARFASRHVEDGMVDEDGELWGADGRLLAMSRQLSIFR